MKTLNENLIDIYNAYKRRKNPPVPIKMIKEFLELEGVHLIE